MQLYALPKEFLSKLFNNIKSLGYEIIATVLEDGVLRVRTVSSFDAVALNVVSVQSPGEYGTKSDRLMLSYTHGPDSPKLFLFPPHQFLFEIEREKDRFRMMCHQNTERRIAFFGIKSCDLASINVLDKTLLAGEYVNVHYTKIRRNMATIIVNCTRPSGTCFCASMGTGPRALEGFDLALTELDDKFVVEVGSEKGEEMLKGIDTTIASEKDVAQTDRLLEEARVKMGRSLDKAFIKEKLYERLESPAFLEISERCLSCGNCTSVCPTCFCNITLDTLSLDGNTTRRDIVWDSCFTYQFAQVAGGNFRPKIWARYRQWLFHKIAYWQDQFGALGCVGCGRCITWCPVGIDITESINKVVQVS